MQPERDNTLKNLFEAERNIPYRIPLSPQEKDDCCLGKHERLKKAFENEGCEVRYRICWFRWSDLPLSEEVRTVFHDDECSHLYLEVDVDDHWKVVDATWDPGLQSILSVNDWEMDMQPGVPAFKTLSPEESAAFMRNITSEDAEIDAKKHHDFYRALNTWFEKIRS